ncbi:hypothetical protein SCB49_09450 [unidentified eubacterium SCB49]|nr:hypothetical protein SCB49_09450 [unidentified eubacterium SCB49]
MTKYMNIMKSVAIIASLFAVVSCETIETDLTEDPNQLTADDANLEFLFNSNQLALASFFETLQFQEATVMRMELMNVSPFYASQYAAGDFDLAWTGAYADLLNETKQLKEIAAAIETPDVNANNYIAAAQILEAYTLVTLVDTFGDVPYSEALQGSNNFDPGRDSGESIYDAARELLLNSITKINGSNSVAISSDIYFNGDMSKWQALANTLLLKLAVTTRLNNNNAAAEANAVINAGNFISDNSGDFDFNWSASAEPESRHPTFQLQYIGGPDIYIANAMLSRMDGDPRFNYYFFQQDGADPYAYPPASGDGFEGRDHGDAGPPVAADFPKVTVQGLYPIGGKYNDGTTEAVSASSGAAGAGISPIMSHAFTRFLIAEAQLTLNGNAGAARSALIAGVTASMDKVTSFQGGANGAGNEPTGAEIQSYIDSVGAAYDAASNEGKLDIIIKEYYKAAWGNGIEVYNNFRRTSYPSDLAPSIAPNPGTFTHSMLYPANYVNNNNNPDAVQKSSVAEKIWWAEGTTFNLDY